MLNAKQEEKLKKIDDFVYKVYNNETLNRMHQTILLYNKELIKEISSLLKFFILKKILNFLHILLRLMKMQKFDKHKMTDWSFYFRHFLKN